MFGTIIVMMRKILTVILSLLVLLTVGYRLFFNKPDTPDVPDNPVHETSIREDGKYTNKEDVALYIHTYNKLPSNYITKTKAKKLGWVPEKGNLWEVTDHMSIGGGEYKNLEGHLPKKDGRKYYECDIDYDGNDRDEKRIVYSNDGLIYYTDDHYETFELLYGDEK